MKITHRIKVTIAAVLLIVSTSGAAVGITYAAQNNTPEASNTETNDDKQSAKSAVEDKGKDGETNDDPTQ
jgi:hypothetical protein